MHVKTSEEKVALATQMLKEAGLETLTKKSAGSYLGNADLKNNNNIGAIPSA